MDKEPCNAKPIATPADATAAAILVVSNPNTPKIITIKSAYNPSFTKLSKNVMIPSSAFPFSNTFLTSLRAILIILAPTSQISKIPNNFKIKAIAAGSTVTVNQFIIISADAVLYVYVVKTSFIMKSPF